MLVDDLDAPEHVDPAGQRPLVPHLGPSEQLGRLDVVEASDAPPVPIVDGIDDAVPLAVVACRNAGQRVRDALAVAQGTGSLLSGHNHVLLFKRSVWYSVDVVDDARHTRLSPQRRCSSASACDHMRAASPPPIIIRQNTQTQR